MKLKILKYSKINKLSFLSNKYKKYNTLLYDRDLIIKTENIEKIDSNENVIINNDYFEYTYIPETTKNIYLGEYKNIDGFVIDFNSFHGYFKYDISNNESLFQEAKVIINDEIIKIPLGNNIEKILVSPDDEKIKIEVRTDINRKRFIIDNKANIKEKKVLYELYGNNKIINLEELTDFSKVDYSSSASIDTLIIPTSTVGKKFDAIYDVYVDNIKIEDNNDMKLIPNNKNIIIDSRVSILPSKDRILILSGIKPIHGVFTILSYKDEFFREITDNSKIISIYNDGNVNIISEDTLKKQINNYKSSNILTMKKNGFINYAILVNANKKHERTIISQSGKIYDVGELFRTYLYLNDLYGKSLKLGSTNIEELIKDYLFYQTDMNIDDVFNDYQQYLEYLNKLNKLGLSKRVLYYSLYYDFQNNTDYFVSIKKMIKNKNMTQEEINLTNEFGKHLIKTIKK